MTCSECKTFSSLLFLFVLCFVTTGCGVEKLFAGQTGSSEDPMIGYESFSGIGETLDGLAWTQGSVEQAQGFYARGKLVNATVIPKEGYGFVKLGVNDPHRYSTYDMAVVLAKGAEVVKKYYPAGDRMLIGDVAGINGGKAGGHSSHQNGLDADISFFNVDRRNSAAGEATMFTPMVSGGKISSKFDLERNYLLLKGLFGTGRVSRVFVDAAVKKALCAFAKSKGEDVTTNNIFRRLTPYPGHANHFHVRISCPMRSPTCENQAPPPMTTGCV